MLSGETLGAQSVVRGAVRVEASTRALAGVGVSIEGVFSALGKTDAQGNFLLVGLPAGRHTLRFRIVGYHPVEAIAELSGQDTLELDIELSPVAQPLPPVEVAARRPGKGTPARRQQHLIELQEIETVIGAAADAYEVVQRLRPGYLRGRGTSNLGKPHATADTSTGAGGAGRVANAERTAAARRPRPLLPKAVIDDGPLEDLDVLRHVPIQEIREIRLMSSLDAAIRYGTGAEGGVIIVTRKH